MGSLISPAKVPSHPQKIIKQASVASVVTESAAKNETASDVLSSEARVENLLRRNRGRLGTIVTRFKGVLDSHTSQKKRKTLLGE
ncbi:MAG: hypothetical protein JKY11_08785 [Alphaproteobacteria bacterium]|nr:hypothetical protein [Alphaproteobacteria bacterium]